MEDGRGNRIHHLTSSAITYGLSRPQSCVLRAGAADGGATPEGYAFRRLSPFTQSAYALVRVDPGNG